MKRPVLQRSSSDPLLSRPPSGKALRHASHRLTLLPPVHDSRYEGWQKGRALSSPALQLMHKIKGPAVLAHISLQASSCLFGLDTMCVTTSGSVSSLLNRPAELAATSAG